MTYRQIFENRAEHLKEKTTDMLVVLYQCYLDAFNHEPSKAWLATKMVAVVLELEARGINVDELF